MQPIVRVSILRCPPDGFAEMRQMMVEAEKVLRPGIESMRGLLAFYVSLTFPTRGKNRVESMVGPRRSPLHRAYRRAIDWCGEARWRLRRQAEVELLNQHLLIGVELGIAREDQRAPVSGWEVHI